MIFKTTIDINLIYYDKNIIILINYIFKINTISLKCIIGS